MVFHYCLPVACALLFLLPGVSAGADKVESDELQLGKSLFQGGATPACAICHTLNDAGSTGTIGPNLDEVMLTIDKVKTTLVEGSGVMPSFADSLSDDEIEALADYVVGASASN